MRKCSKCNLEYNDEINFCRKCGGQLDSPIATVSNEKKSSLPKIYYFSIILVLLGIFALNQAKFTRDYIMGIFLILIGISLLPFIYSVFLKKCKIKGLNIIVPVVLSVLLIALWGSIGESKEKSNSNSNYEPSNNTSENNNDSSSSGSNLNAIKNSKIRENFVKACNAIKMDSGKVKSIEQIQDWNNGPRYSFTYEGNDFLLYAYDTGSIDGITIVNHFRDQIYKDGLDPWNVNDFLVDSGKVIPLEVKAESKIKPLLNYPSTAKFHWLTTAGVSRYKEIYVLTGEFEAENALGQKLTNEIYAEVKINGENYDFIYLKINNKNYIGSKSQIKKPDRKEVKTEDEKTDSNDMIIKYGQKGQYGKEDNFDGEKEIRYYIPTGKYQVEALVKNSNFYIETIKLHKEDGYDTATTIRRVNLLNVGSKDAIEIKSGECISLMINAQVKLTKIK